MALNFSRFLSAFGMSAAIAVAGWFVTSDMASAQQTYIYTPRSGYTQGDLPDDKVKTRTVLRAERYEPTIWIDPDGCEHWVMDDGWEGFMTPHVTRDGKPVCHSLKRK